MSRQRTRIVTDDPARLEELLATADDPRTRERLLAARMATTGEYTLGMIAKAVGRARSVIQTWLDKFQSEGPDALITRKKPGGRPPSLDAGVQTEVREKLREGTWRTAGQFRRWLEETHGITLSEAGSYYWLGKSQGVLKAPRPCHRKQTPGDIEQFKTGGWETKLAELDIPAGESVRFWVMDEPERSADRLPQAARRASTASQPRFGLHTIVRHCWGLRGERVVRPFQQKFDWDYVYGAISVLDGEPVFCHLPTVTCEAVWEFLRQLVQTQPDAHHVVLWDGAGLIRPAGSPCGLPCGSRSRSARLHQPPPADPEWADLARMHTIKLPPYCPELNPTEKIWDQLKDEVCNRVYDTIDALRAALLPKLREFWEPPGGLGSLIGCGWLRQKVNAGCRLILPVFN